MNPHAEALDPKSSVSANSTTLAWCITTTDKYFIDFSDLCQYEEDRKINIFLYFISVTKIIINFNEELCVRICFEKYK